MSAPGTRIPAHQSTRRTVVEGARKPHGRGLTARRWAVAVWIGTCSTFGWAQGAAKSDAAFPTRAIKIVVAYSPGAGVDLMARAVAQKLAESVGQPVVVENRPGAHAIVGADYVAKQPADGYTLLVIDRGALTINPSLYKSLPYNPLKDFAYTGIATELRYVLAINPALPAKSFAEFVQLAKTKPGGLNYASFGTGSIVQLNFERLKTHAGIDLTHVPYKGTTQVVTSVMAGDAHIMMSSPEGVMNYVRDGRLRALAVGSPARMPMLPEVPTLQEAGGGADTLVPTYFTFAAPGGTPRAVVMKLHTELGKALAAPEVAERLARGGLIAQPSTPEAFAESVRLDIERFGKLVRELGIQAQ